MRAALVPVLLASALTASAAAAAPNKAAKGHGNASPPGQVHVPPGQAKKAEPAGGAEVSRAPAATEQAKKEDSSRTVDGATKKNDSSGADARSPKTTSSPGASRQAAAAEAAQAPPAAAATPAATQPTAAVPAVAPQPVQPTAPAAQPAAAPAAQHAVSSTRSSGTGLRRAPRARRTAAARRAAAPVRAAVAATLSAPAPAAESAPARSSGGGATRERDRSPLTRTVVRVLEVIPSEVRLALALLALLGLLLGAATAVQTVRSRRLVRQRRLLLADVGVLQSALLPDLPERIGAARVTAAYRPAAGLAAGGDFYDAFELPGGRTGVIVGDVAGHGRDAVPLTALVRYNLRAYLEAGLTPRATLDVASNVLAPQLGGRQVTIVVAIFDPGTGRLTYACAGHWPPLLLGTTATPVTACSSPPIGAGIATGRRQTTVALPPGAAACFVTDGLGEVPVAHGGRLGREGVREELRAAGAHGDAGDLIARVVRRSVAQPDDMAACIISPLPGGAEHWSLQLEELEADRAMLDGGWVEQFLVACGVAGPHLTRALAEAREMVGLAGTAIVEVRIGEQLLEVRVGQPPAVSMPIARRRLSALDLAATG